MSGFFSALNNIFSKFFYEKKATANQNNLRNSENKNATELYYMGLKYYYGAEVSQNFLKATEYLIQSANQGYVEAQYRLGAMYETGAGVEKNIETALYWYHKGASLHDQRCQDCYNRLSYPEHFKGSPILPILFPKTPTDLYDLGEKFLYGYYMPRSTNKAIDFYLQAANQGHAGAQYKLGYIYNKGVGVPNNYDLAFKYYLQAAKQGHAKAQYHTGLMYLNGKGVQCDKQLAKKWINEAKGQGLPEAFTVRFEQNEETTASKAMKLHNLGDTYYKENDFDTAFSYYSQAAALGNIDAQFKLGMMYKHGKGTTSDYKEAALWYCEAAKRGHADAQNSLGVMYEEGKGVNQSYKDAIRWYLQSAKHGNAFAQFNLGELYNEGKGVPQDKNKAEEFYVKAAKRGINQARERLKDIQDLKINKTKSSFTNNNAGNLASDRMKNASTSLRLFDKAKEVKRNGDYREALKLYKQAYKEFPEDSDVQSTMYAMAKIYLLIGDYEKACALFQDGLTMKLAQNRERTAKFYQKYVMTKFTGGLSESDPEYVWFRNLTADYSIFIGLSHYLLENEGAELLSQYRYDFNNHMQSLAGKSAAMPSREYLQTCYEYGWVRVILIASEFMDRGIPEINIDHVQERKQEFLDILKTIG